MPFRFNPFTDRLDLAESGAIPPGGGIQTITGNDAVAVGPSLTNNVFLVGSGSITTSGNAGTFTETIALTGLTNHAVLVGAGTSTITKVGPTATAGQVLQSAGAAADPAFSTATYPSTTTINQILYSTSNNVVGELTTGANQILSCNGSGVPAFASQLFGDYSFTSQTAGNTRQVAINNTDNTNAASSALLLMEVAGASAGDPYIQFVIDNANNWAIGADNSASDAFVIAANSSLGTTNAVSISTSRVVDFPVQPKFSAYLNPTVTNVTGDNTAYTIIFDNTFFDTTSSFNTGTGVYTFPATGTYLMTAGISVQNISATHLSGTSQIVTTARNYRIANVSWFAVSTSGATYYVVGSAIVDATAGDTASVVITVNGASKTINIEGSTGPVTRFQGYKLP